VERFYVGMTEEIAARLDRHNAGRVSHARKFRPWRLKTYVCFSDDDQTSAFEKYLKSASGRAFAKKRL
jgi:predicted GIY-YIG superfamily endonuclease